MFIDLVLSVLIADLGAPQFRTREAAQRTLAGPGLLVRSAIQRGTGSPSLEIAARCRALLSLAEARSNRNAWERAGDMLLAGRTDHPWLILPKCCDAARQKWGPWSYYGTNVDSYLDLAYANHGAIAGTKEDDWKSYRTATRVWVHRRLLAGDSEALIRDWLRVMVAEEKK